MANRSKRWSIEVAGDEHSMTINNSTPWPITVNFTVQGVTVHKDTVPPAPRKRAKGK